MIGRVLITGGGSGIGRAVAEKIVSLGGRVAVTGRRADRLAELALLHPGAVVALAADLTVPAQRRDLVCRARDALGGLDGLVYAAGCVAHQPLGSIGEQELRAQLELNLVAPLRLGEEALQVLPEGGGMVFVSSTLAYRPVRTSAVYSAAKAGLLSVMRSLALAGAERRVRANAVCPGLVDTEMLRDSGRPLEDLAALEPLGRLGQPPDVAQAVAYLLSAPWVTGAALTVDGGLMLRE